jgi:hypothetical protein
VSAAESLETIPQAVLQLSRDFTDPKTGTDPDEIRRVLRHDAYLGLTMGIKSFNIWSMWESRPNLTTHNEQFLAYASVANDLTGELDLQRVFLFGEERDDLDIDILNGIDEIKYKARNGSTYEYDALHYYNAALGSDRYLFLVNSTEQPMDVRIRDLPSSFLLEDLFAGTTMEIQQPSFTHRLDVLGVAALRFRQLDAGAALNALSAGVQAVPEPSAAIMAAIGAIFWLGFSRRRAR